MRQTTKGGNVTDEDVRNSPPVLFDFDGGDGKETNKLQGYVIVAATKLPWYSRRRNLDSLVLKVGAAIL